MSNSCSLEFHRKQNGAKSAYTDELAEQFAAQAGGLAPNIITEADLYGGSIRLFQHVSEKNGLTFSHVDCSNEDVEAYINGNTKGREPAPS